MLPPRVKSSSTANQHVCLENTLGLPTVYLRSTYGLRSVISLAISGSFLLILIESLTKRKGRKLFFSEITDFQVRKTVFVG